MAEIGVPSGSPVSLASACFRVMWDKGSLVDRLC